jgi:site-specific recombinase XerD
MTVNTILDMWKATLLSRKSPETIKNYLPDNIKFFDWYKAYKGLSDVNLDNIKNIIPAEIDLYINFLMNEKNNSNQTINRKICSLRAFFEFMKDGLHYIDNNIINNVSGLIVRVERPVYCGTTHIRNAVDNIKTHYKIRDKAIILFDGNTGLRRAEISNVKISDIDFEHKQLYVIGKGSKERVIDLNDDVMDIIHEWLAVRPETDNDYLFVSERKGKMSKEAIYYVVKRNLEQINPKFATHTLRRAFLTTMLESGVPVVLARELAGHKSVETTQRYFISSPEQKRKAVNTVKI